MQHNLKISLASYSLASWTLIATVLIGGSIPQRLPACCAVGRLGQHVVNSDQAVIIVWDAANKMQHFIRRASFRGGGTDLGFIIPSPPRPNLQETTDEAFRLLDRLTSPPEPVPRPTWGKGKSYSHDAAPVRVRVLEMKQVAGFDAAVLEADSADALVRWLEKHDYSYSPAVRDWAKPYIDAKWTFTALKISKSDENGHANAVAAKPLRMSFHTERPLFPYREPATDVPKEDGAHEKSLIESLQEFEAIQRTLIIYFLSDARYRGHFDGTHPEWVYGEERWGGWVACAMPIKPDFHRTVVTALGLPELAGSATRWLTKFEDDWPYRLQSADVVFTKSENTNILEPRRPGRND